MNTISMFIKNIVKKLKIKFKEDKMSLDFLDAFSVLIIAISLATDRLVKLAINFGKAFNLNIYFYMFLEKIKFDHRKILIKKFLVYLISFASACITVGFLTEKNNVDWCLFDCITIKFGDYSRKIHLLFIALLATGGSSFWKNFNGYIKNIRDLKRKELNK